MKRKLELDAKSILSKVASDEERKTVSLYVSVKAYDNFKAACGDKPPSRVLEELMKVFTESVKSN